MSSKPYPDYVSSGIEWLTNVPAGWQLERIRRRVALQTKKSADSDKKVALENIESWTGRFIDVEDADYSGEGVSFAPDDVLFGKLRPYLAKAWRAEFYGSAVGDFHVYRANPDLDPRFLRFILVNPSFVSLVVGSTYGAKMPRASWDFIGSLVEAFPPIEEQRQIADYLDVQTARIDALIGKQEELIETLAERLDGAWASIVQGLHVSSPTLPLRRMVNSIVDGPFGSSLTSAHYSDEGAGVVRLGNIGINQFKLDDRAYIPEAYAAELRAHAVRPGDVVVAGLGDEKMPLGRAATVPSGFGEGIVKADCYRVRPTSNVSGAFLAWILSSPQSRTQFQALSRGSTRQRLNTQVVREVLVPLPTIEQQESALETFSAIQAANDALSAKAREMIDVLKERRQALISAAVTGKIDVRGLA